ncbi:hypothetical protein [Gracilimonas mengyeensis]|uniref:Uncharacterized protein n=1 Tax=Gracilimonas mengyeensis TaxID=1302730 RepID=A0A521FI32_9BACT|nr:hypothetical protein [Gracilimonas mengyeensis]SMO95654.1 hypothetical protein SAMN06265219_11937 [Gracilimonas mengyeensis]
MLIRLISVISLILFMLLMLSGANIDIALYRSMIVFMSLFAVIYITIFLLNVVKENHSENMTMSSSGSGGGNTKAKGEH